MNTEADSSQKVIWLYQKQDKIYPRAVHGLFARWRWVMVWLTQLVFYGLPWLQWNDRQALLFDLEARRFFIFGLVLYPQDFIYLTALLVICAYALFLFTAVGGRLWCGFACPQTVYTEIFLWVERKIEGDRQKRMKLDSAGWSAQKLARKSAKHAAWGAIGLWTGFTFVGYFTPIRSLGGATVGGMLGPWEIFWILFYGFATYGNAGFLREQVCKYMCPYARFQSAMFDKDTLIISYDAERGEPRGARSRQADPAALGLGSCVDCTLCVQVCPTGIDIRKGLQYECIGCAACIDVCDTVMEKMNYPKGLIRYVTQNGLARHLSSRQMWARVFRPRVLIYSAVLGAIVTAFLTSLALRAPFRVDVVRDRNALARQVEDGRIENVYRLQVMNATESTQKYEVRVIGLDQARVIARGQLELPPAGMRWWPVSVQVPYEAAQAMGSGVHKMSFEVRQLPADGRGEATLSERTTFMVPR